MVVKTNKRTKYICGKSGLTGIMRIDSRWLVTQIGPTAAPTSIEIVYTQSVSSGRHCTAHRAPNFCSSAQVPLELHEYSSTVLKASCRSLAQEAGTSPAADLITPTNGQPLISGLCRCTCLLTHHASGTARSPERHAYCIIATAVGYIFVESNVWYSRHRRRLHPPSRTDRLQNGS
jgi:hypothetical protein